MSAGGIAASGLQAAQMMMEVVGDNVANVNTAGYKKVNATFADVYANGATLNPGLGVQVWTVEQNFSQGNVQLTGNGLDLSINNDGFFIQKDASSGQTSYTRDGIFQLDQNGYIITQDGSRLQGYPATNGVVSTTGSLSDMQISQSPIPANATTTATLALNLNAAAQPPTVAPFNPATSTSYNFVTQTTVYDSLGTSYPMDLYYINTGANTWDVQSYINGVNSNAAGLATPYALTFNSSGALTAPAGGLLTGITYTPTGGAAAMTITANLSEATQYTGAYSLTTNTQDGYASGTPTGYNIDNSGNIYVHYSTGNALNQGQIALAKFVAPEGLERTSTMSWLSTNASGNPIVESSTSVNGFTPGAVEFSNVDLPSELINLLDAQQWYSANAEVEKTYNQSIQTILNVT